MTSALRSREWRGWTLHEADTLASTNDHARDLPPWHAIRAKTQTGARGRHGRRWSSGEGGLWISVVLPLDPPDRGWSAFPLAAGLAVVSTLRGLGLTQARLRWPNDVLIGPKKICGILMEKFAPDRVVVGLGLNVTNNPAAQDPELAAIATFIDTTLNEKDIRGAISIANVAITDFKFSDEFNKAIEQWIFQLISHQSGRFPRVCGKPFDSFPDTT